MSQGMILFTLSTKNSIHIGRLSLMGKKYLPDRHAIIADKEE